MNALFMAAGLGGAFLLVKLQSIRAKFDNAGLKLSLFDALIAYLRGDLREVERIDAEGAEGRRRMNAIFEKLGRSRRGSDPPPEAFDTGSHSASPVKECRCKH